MRCSSIGISTTATNQLGCVCTTEELAAVAAAPMVLAEEDMNTSMEQKGEGGGAVYVL